MHISRKGYKYWSGSSLIPYLVLSTTALKGKTESIKVQADRTEPSPITCAISTKSSCAELVTYMVILILNNPYFTHAGPRSAVGNVSGNRCQSDCRSRGREFDPGPVPYFRGD